MLEDEILRRRRDWENHLNSKIKNISNINVKAIYLHKSPFK